MNILDKRFDYVPSTHTDIRKTFERARSSQAQVEAVTAAQCEADRKARVAEQEHGINTRVAEQANVIHQEYAVRGWEVRGNYIDNDCEHGILLGDAADQIQTTTKPTNSLHGGLEIVRKA